MIRALLYLRLTSLKNSLLSRLRRLRQPKYLFGAIVGAAYLWFFFFRHITGNGHRAAPPTAMPEGLSLSLDDTSPLVIALGSLALFILVAITWIAPGQKPGLGFTEAETAFLFPAPVGRRMLINFKLVGSQFTIFFTSFFFTLVSNRWSFLGGNGLTHAIGWWVILSTLNLHFMGANLALNRLFEKGASTTRRRLMLSGGIVLALVATVAWLWRDLQAPVAGDVADAGAFSHYLLLLLNGGVLGWLLWPFRLVIAPFAAADVHAFLLALGPALLLMAIHYFWVMRMHEISFEESSIAMAEKRGARIAQVRAGTYRFGAEKPKARREPFLLAEVGWPEMAFFWKNLLSTRPYFNVRTFAVLAAIIVVGSRWIPHGGDIGKVVKSVAIGASLFSAGYILLLGPHLARQDLRNDLANADVLKTYPIRGWRLMLGELLTPVAILSGLFWLALLAGMLVFTPTRNIPKYFTPGLQVTGTVCIAAIAPLLIALQLLVLNAATLVFPGWFQTARGQAGGIEVMGQRLIFVFGNLVVIVTALLPSACAAFVAMGGVYGFWSVVHFFGGSEAQFFTGSGFGAAFLAVLVILVGEVWCGLWWLGGRFEKFDLSSELRP